MSDAKELTIETLAVEIKVIRVGGHKMTAAVFDQIQVDEKMFYLYDGYDQWVSRLKNNEKAMTALGYVNRNRRMYLLYTKDHRLHKAVVWEVDGGQDARQEHISRLKNYLRETYTQLFIAT